MKKNEQLSAFTNALSLLMLFTAFFTSYMFAHSNLVNAFIKGIIAYIIAKIILKLLVFVWNFSFSSGEWRMITNPPKELDENYLNTEE